MIIGANIGVGFGSEAPSPRLTAASGSLTLTGNAATLGRNVPMTASAGALTLTGNALASAGANPNTIPNNVLWLRADVGVTITGQGASTVADQSGQGNDGTQSTDGSRMVQITDTDGKTALGENTNTGLRSLILPANFYNFWHNTSGEPFTLIVLARRIGTISATVEVLQWGAINYSPIRFGFGAVGTKYGHFFSSTASGTWTDTQDTAYHSLDSTFTGTSCTFAQDGVTDASSPLTITAATCGASAQINMQNSLWREIAVYQRVLSAAERKLVHNGMRARWGIAQL